MRFFRPKSRRPPRNYSPVESERARALSLTKAMQADTALAMLAQEPPTAEELEMFDVEMDASIALEDLEATMILIEREETAEQERQREYAAAMERVVEFVDSYVRVQPATDEEVVAMLALAETERRDEYISGVLGLEPSL